MIKLNGVEVDVTIFPDNTSQVWQIPEEVFRKRNIHEQEITWEFESEGEFIHVAQLCDLIAAKGGWVDRLYIPYFPYARQDKEISNNTTFAKQTFIRLLGSLTNVQGIESYDIHSDTFSGGVVSDSIKIEKIIDIAYNINPSCLWCFPDKGAKERYSVYPWKHKTPRSCSFTKERDQETGYIKRLYLNEVEFNIKDETFLIVDDLCDGGMTFKLTAERLYELGASEVHLYVSHGLFTKGTDTLRESGIRRIFTHKGEVE